LSRGVDVDAINYSRATPLKLAAGNGHDQVVKVLLEHGSDVSWCVSSKDFSSLHFTMFSRNLVDTSLFFDSLFKVSHSD
jgi:ankyrin repeat protein